MSSSTETIEGLKSDQIELVDKAITGDDSQCQQSSPGISAAGKSGVKVGDGKELPPAVPFLKLFTFADRLDCLLMFLGTSASIAVGAGTAGGFLLFGSMVDAFGNNASTMTTSDLVDAVSKVSLQYLYVGAAIAAAAFVEATTWVASGLRQSTRIRTAYLIAVLRQDVSFYDTEVSTGEVVARLSGDTLLIQEAISQKMGYFLQYMSIFLFGYVIAFIRGWKLALVTTANLPLVFGAGAIFAVAAQAHSKSGSDAYGEAGKVVEQVIGAMRTVVSFNGEKKAVDDYDQALIKSYKASVAQSFFTSMGMLAVFFIIFSSYSLALWYSAKLVINDGYSGGDVLVVIFGILQGGMSLGQAAPLVATFQLGQQAAYKMFNVIKMTPTIDSSDPGGESIPSLQGHCEFRQVTFSYPSRPGVEIFSNLCLSIPAGAIAAVVGESGGGKSTLISLLERFYDPQSGSVLVDGFDIKTLNVKWWRRQVALVSQEPVIFGTTISENISYGSDEATMQDIQRAAEQANAASFIQELPEGYNTHVGEHGTSLSGGQKQRVAIARAILKGPRILLLDEATSALDSRSEVLVQEALDRFMKDRTTIVVAHRLSTIRHADFIAVMQRGTVAETGTHAELLNVDGGVYRQLVRLQELKKGNEASESGVVIGEAEEASPAVHIGTDSSSGRRSFSHRDEAETGLGLINGKRRSRWFGIRPGTSDDEKKGASDGHKAPSFFRLATLLDRPAIVLCVVGCVAAALFGATNTLFALVLSRVVGALYEPDPHKLQTRMNFWASIMAVMAAGVAIVAPTRIFAIKVMGLKLVRKVRRSMFAKIVRQEISWFDLPKNSRGALSSRLATDAALVEVLVGDMVSLAAQNSSTIVAALVIGFTANWQLTLVVLALTPFLVFFSYTQMQQLQESGDKAKALYEDASELACNAVGSIRTVASFCAEERVAQAFQAKCQGPQKRGINQGLGIGLGLAFANLTVYGATALCFYYGSQLVKDGKTTFDKVFTVYLAISLSAGAVSAASASVPDLSKVKTAVTSIFGMMDQTSKIDATSSDGKSLPSVRGLVEYQQVNFSYPGRPNVPIFKNLSVTVPEGKSVALVGASGSGKSTMFALLERFYDPDSGSILLDGVNIQDLQLRWLRKQLGMVSQEPLVFDDTIESNIVYGCHNSGGEGSAVVAQQEIEAAAIAANAHSFISALPQGYSTTVGERGIQLSGGQKQRVAIARAVIRNPKVLLLDEATSALDAESEKVVQDALDRIMVNRTTIVIAHRLSTIQNAHIIAVVKDGRIVEQGRHEDLISKPHGAYAALANLQTPNS